MPVNEAQRPHLEFMRMLARDSQDREVLIGLTYDETEWYFGHLAAEYSPDPSPRKGNAEHRSAVDRYLQLHDKHESARIEIINAEIEARDHPVRN